MKDKIMKILPPQSATPFDMDATAQAILDLIAKSLPKEKEEEYGLDICKEWEHANKEEYCSVCDGIVQGYNQCLKDIKHKMRVE